MTLTSTLIAVDLSGKLLSDPSVGQLRKAISVHAVAFSSHGNLLMVESEGEFNYNTWEAICAQAERICRGSDIHQGDGEDVSMDARGDMSLEDVLRTKMQEKLVTDHKWKEPMA